ncbi:MAG: thioesterase family protein [Pseudomonadota bacterium]
MSAPAADWDFPEPFTIDISPTPEDVDGFGHVNNLVYARWCVECAWAHSEALGFSFDDYRRLGRGMVVHHHEFDYVGQAVEGERLLVATWVLENDGRLRMTRGYQIVRSRSGETLLRGSTRFVCIDMATLRPARMPRAFAEGYPPVQA